MNNIAKDINSLSPFYPISGIYVSKTIVEQLFT